MSSPGYHVGIRRVYDASADGDGVRILVDRLWPRGLTKEKAAVDLWLPEVAPSNALRKRFGHKTERWNEFRQAYREELTRNAAAVDELRSMAEYGPITLLYAAKDTAQNNAVVLREFLTERRKTPSDR